MKFRKSLIALCVSCALLSACGSGGSGSGTTSMPNVNTDPNVGGRAVPQMNGKFKGQRNFAQDSNADRAAANGNGATILLSDTGVDMGVADKLSIHVEKEMVHIDDDKNIFRTATRQTNSPHGTSMVQIMSQHGANGAKVAVVGHITGVATTRDIAQAELEALKNRNDVAVINQSFGLEDQDYSKIDKYPSIVARYAEIVRTKNPLIVKAAGNSGQANPGVDSVLYMNGTENAKIVERNWLIATGMKDGDVNRNRCGLAKDNCIAVNETHRVEQNGKSVLTGGSSNAAAVVSATAARIKSRLDWMGGAELKRSIISTADDAGNKGVDSIFGVGILNEPRALGGYGKVNGQEVLNVAGKKREYFFDNDITGTGGITKNGSASLILMGRNTYNGENVVNNGSLVLASANTAANRVNSNGRLVVGANPSDDITSGSVTLNGGRLSAETANDFIVNGNLAVKGGTVDKAVGSAIKVSGKADISGNSTLNVTDAYKGYVSKAGQQATLLSADAINGRFANVADKTNGLIDSSVHQSASDITVTLKRNDVGTVVPQSAYSGAKADAAKLEEVFRRFDTAKDNGTLTKAQENSAAVYTNSTNMTATLFEQGTATRRHSLQNRIDQELMQNSRFAGRLQDVRYGGNAWVDYTGSAAKLDTDGISGKSHENNFGIGAGKRFGRHLFAAAANRFESRWSERFAGVAKTLKNDGYGADFGYAYLLGNGFDLFATAAWNHIDSGRLYGFGFGAGKAFFWDKWFLRPEIGLQYVRARTKNTDVSATQYLDRLDGKAAAAAMGVHAAYSVGRHFALFGKANVVRDLHNKTAERATIKGTGVTVSDSESKRRTRAGIEIGAVYQTDDNWSFSAGMRHDRASHWHNTAVNAGLKYRF